MSGSLRVIKPVQYQQLFHSVSTLLETARHSAAKAVNALMTATYWEIGRRIVQFEQRGKGRAAYGDELLAQLADDLTARFGRGFAKSNLYLMRGFYLAYREIFQTASGTLRG